MKLYFTTSNLIFSKVIRWALKEPCSHFAVCFDDRVVFQSNLVGTSLCWADVFRSKNVVVKEISLNLSLEQEEAIYQNLIRMSSKPYDWVAFFYFCYRGLLFRLFNKPLPAHGPQRSGAYLCTEVAYALKPIADIKEELAIISPYKLYYLLKNKIKKL